MTSSTTHPLVVVGITTRNRAAILSKAITSALAQAYPAILVSVLDDGSTDDTWTLQKLFPNVRWHRHELSRGIIDSRNHLMQTALGSYYVSLDDDAWFIRGDEIADAVARMEADPQLGAIAFDILSPDRPDLVERSPARQAGMFIGCGHMLRLSAASEAGYYAPTPGTYGSEERDLSLRLADMGYGIELLPGVHVWHDKAWTGRDWFPLHRSGVCNELVMTLRRCPFPDLLFVLPLKVASYVRYWLLNPSFLRAGVFGLGDFLRFGPAIWRSRRPVSRATFWRLGKGSHVR